MPDPFTFDLVSPEKLLLSEDVEMVVVPGAEGDFGVLMLRSAEAGGIRGIAGQLASGMTAGGAAAAGFVSPTPVLAGGAAALFIPHVFSKIVTIVSNVTFFPSHNLNNLYSYH